MCWAQYRMHISAQHMLPASIDYIIVYRARPHVSLSESLGWGEGKSERRSSRTKYIMHAVHNTYVYKTDLHTCVNNTVTAVKQTNCQQGNHQCAILVFGSLGSLHLQ